MNLIETVQDCKKGKLSAQKTLYTQYKSLLFEICMRYTKDMLSAENMLHDSFLMVCREIRAYKELVPFEPWLKGMVIGYILRKYKDLIPDTSLVDYNTSEHLKVFNEEIAKIPAANIIRLIQGLPQSQRTVFNLYNLDGLNHKEISQALSISVHSSQTYYQLAVEKLSSEVADDKYTKETIE